MSSLLLTIVVQTALVTAGVEVTPVSAKTYSAAREIVTETGKPLMVMVGADWCGPCQTMKKKVLPGVLQGGLLRKVVFAVVNTDRDHKLAEELTGGGPIPQLVMFRKKGDGWVRKKLVGGQTPETVEQFIKDGVEDAENAEDSEISKTSETPGDEEDADLPNGESTTDRKEVVRDEDEGRHG